MPFTETGIPFSKPITHLLLAIRSILRRTRQLPGAGERSVARIFQFPALVADVPQIAIAAVNLFAAGGHGNSALLGVVETVFARLQIPLAPRRDHFQLRSQRLIGKFKADLIVALAGAAVCDRGCAFAQRHFHLVLGDYRPRQRGSQQIFMLVHCTCLQRRKHVSGQKLLAHVFDDHLAGAGLVSFFDDGFDVVSLAHVSDHGDHVVGVVFLQPGNDDGGIEPSGISKNYFVSGIRIPRIRAAHLAAKQ